MISKRIGVQPGSDNYGRLAKYILGAHEAEKTLYAWANGCIDNRDYLDCIEEVQDTQACNTRTQKAKTYHLMISFRPEDENKLSSEFFEYVERRFAQALGFEEHQRHCGVHKNTANIHMHVAYNMIHPERLTRHEPFRDYWTRDKLCRQLEQELGLAVDLGVETPNQTRISDKAATMEARTGQQSFQSYAVGQKQNISAALAKAQNWQDFHGQLCAYGLEITKHGNGLIIKNRHGKEAVKASAVALDFSMRRLTEQLGAFEENKGKQNAQELTCYSAAPLHRGPERGQLFADYKQALQERIARLEQIKQEEMAKLTAIKQEWELERRSIQRMTIAKKNRNNLSRLARMHEMEATAKARLEMQLKRDQVKAGIPFSNWTDFLRMQASQGNETALAILRSKNEPAESEKTTVKDWSTHGLDQTEIKKLRADYAEQNRSLLERRDISSKEKSQLQAVIRMEQTISEARAKGTPIAQAAPTIDTKGTVIFTLSNGDRVRDSGKQLSFTPTHTAREIAFAYAKRKWGKSLRIEGNLIIRGQQQEKEYSY